MKEGRNEAPAREGHGREPVDRMDAVELEEDGRDLTRTAVARPRAEERLLAWAEVQVAEAGGARWRLPKAVPAPAPLPAWPGVEASAEPGWRKLRLAVGCATSVQNPGEQAKHLTFWSECGRFCGADWKNHVSLEDF